MVNWIIYSNNAIYDNKKVNITNYNIVPIDQTSREKFLGDAISSVLWGNNMTYIGPARFHLAGNCVTYWIRCCPEHTAITHSTHIYWYNQKMSSSWAELLPRPGVNSNRMSFSSFLEFLKEETGGCECVSCYPEMKHWQKLHFKWNRNMAGQQNVREQAGDHVWVNRWKWHLWTKEKTWYRRHVLRHTRLQSRG